MSSTLFGDDKPSVIYEFWDTSPTDYTLAIRVPVQGKVMKSMYDKVAKKYQKKTGDKVQGELDSFPANPEMLNLLKTSVKRYIKEARAQIKVEHGVILNQIIPKSGFYHKLPDGDWLFELKLEGLYSHE